MSNKIVIVEDNPSDAKIVRMALGRCNADLQTVVLEDGEKAVHYFLSPESKGAELVLLDLNLPVKSGFEVLEFLKADVHWKKIPVVILSGSSSQTEVDICYDLGANSYICKPAGIDEVFSMASQLVAYWFGHAKLPKSL